VVNVDQSSGELTVQEVDGGFGANDHFQVSQLRRIVEVF